MNHFVLYFTSCIFLLSSLFFISCNATTLIEETDKIKMKTITSTVMISSLSIYLYITLLSREFWVMQKAMIQMNTQVFGRQPYNKM
jgi:isoprenylcysteine carboxyl methyltransferase (ICMT) family protein YpbQ